ncbi:Amuc_1099 family pilus-like system protein [Prosthecobacter sp.]|uniref:Amuc_1099 family pilus-like system protein n=1 Tax=Prosthecobacter sp. TaxID=1965333 RepID=UPI0037849616
MQNRKGNYEKTILIISSLLAIGVAVFLILESQAFEDGLVLGQATSRNELNPPDQAKVADAITTIQKKYQWIAPVRNGKPVPLNKSVMILMKDNALFDITLPEPMLRPPMTNIFLTGDKSKVPPEKELAGIYSPNVGDLDEDNDGFFNLEEFNGKTDPRDPESHPPYTNKLFLTKRISHDYILLLKGGSEGSFQIARTVPGKPVSKFQKVGEEFGFADPGQRTTINRFKIISSRQEKIQHPTLGERDGTILKMLDMSTTKEFDLVEGKDYNLAEYEAEFEFRWKVRKVIPGIKEGGTFVLPGLAKTYYIRTLEETKATISPLGPDGKPAAEIITIKQG